MTLIRQYARLQSARIPLLPLLLAATVPRATPICDGSRPEQRGSPTGYYTARVRDVCSPLVLQQRKAKRADLKNIKAEYHILLEL